MSQSENCAWRSFFLSNACQSTKVGTLRCLVSAVFILLLLLVPIRAHAATTRYVCGGNAGTTQGIAACNSNGGSGWSGTPADSGTCTSKNNPCLTIHYAASQMAPSDTLIIGNGTYQGVNNMLSCNAGASYCTQSSFQDHDWDMAGLSGSPGSYTVIKADTDWGVTMDGQGTNYAGLISDWSYGIVRGIIFKNSAASGLELMHSSNSKILRCGSEDANGSGLDLSHVSSDDLVEQSFAFGSGTYFIVDNSYDKWGPNSNDVFRENVVRRDGYISSDNHYASFGTYEVPASGTHTYFFDNISVDSEFYPDPLSNYPGSIALPQSGTVTAISGTTITDGSSNWTTNEWGGNEMLYFTSGADAGHEEVVTSYTTNTATVSSWQVTPAVGDNFIIGRDPYTQASFYTANSKYAQSGLVVNGFLAINDDDDAFDTDQQYGQTVQNASWFVSPKARPRGGALTWGEETITNSVISGENLPTNSQAGFTIGIDTSATLFQNNISYGNYYGVEEGNSGATFNYDDIYGNTAGEYGAASGTGTNIVTISPTANGLLYPTSIESGSALATDGAGGGQIGPTMLYRIGLTGSAAECGGSNDGTMSCLTADEPGFDAVSTVSLWPWPNEATIKKLMSSYNSFGENGQRGFCAPGNDKWGQPITLTRYIWQYLGSEIPASIYGTCP